MLGDNKLVAASHSWAGIGRARAEKALRRSVGVGWRLVIGFGYVEGGIGILRGIVRQLTLRRLNCRNVGL
jgi:hypothetical protein